jgi:hypothetical protein
MLILYSLESFLRCIHLNEVQEVDCRYVPPDHLLLDRSPNIGPLISCWELDKSKNCWNESFRTTKILTLLYQQFLNSLISRQDMTGPRLGALSNNRWSGGNGLKKKFDRGDHCILNEQWVGLGRPDHLEQKLSHSRRPYFYFFFVTGHYGLRSTAWWGNWSAAAMHGTFQACARARTCVHIHRMTGYVANGISNFSEQNAPIGGQQD